MYLEMYLVRGASMHRHHREFSFFEERGHGRFGGRGRLFDRMGGGFGGGFMGPGMRAAKMLASGDLRLIILALLAEKPRHGYEIIKAIEEHSSGIYSPSPGMVYPALTYLEDLGYTSVQSEGTKKLYSITATGTAHLNENRASAEETLEQLARFGRKVSHFQKRFTEENEEGDDFGADPPGGIRSDWRQMKTELRDFQNEFRAVLHEKLDASPEERTRVFAILRRALDEIRGQRP
jgi:DNA-binding PadR family transcriptional regulator